MRRSFKRRAGWPAAAVSLLLLWTGGPPALLCLVPGPSTLGPTHGFTGARGNHIVGTPVNSIRQASSEGTSGSERQVAQEDDKAVSKTDMLKFAIPALGIYLASPLMGNVDNAFVGRFSGTAELAAMSPGTVLANNVLFLFSSILNAATTGLVSRAWSGGLSDDAIPKAKAQLERAMSVAWVTGIALTIFYGAATPWAVRAIGTPSSIAGKAAMYARITGLVSWASLAQGVCLSALLSTRDAVTPLRVILSAQVLNFELDFLLCCWPFRTGLAGAAVATSISTVVGFGLMARALITKGLFPNPRLPTQHDIKPVLEYAGPLFVISAARIVGFSAMALTAASIGTEQLAAYQVIISLFVVFVFVSGPISQSAQALLPSLIDAKDTKPLRRTLKNLLVISLAISTVTTSLYCLALRFGSSAFTSDVRVLQLIVSHGPSALVPMATLLVLSTVDGAMTAAKDFRLVVVYQLVAVAVQLILLAEARRRGWGLSFVFMTFALRLWICGFSAAGLIIAGVGRLGGAIGLMRKGTFASERD